MRNRTEMVTTTFQDSENDEDQSFDDSEEDWKPAKKEIGKKGKVANKSTQKRKSAAGGRGTSKRSKKQSDESDDDDDEENEENEDDSDEDEDEDDEEYGSDEEENSKGNNQKQSHLQRKRGIIHVGKNHPDKDGYMELYVFKNDLSTDFRNDEKLCMWRRDGASLLQKYLAVREECADDKLILKGSSVYSCWEEKRKNDFLSVKVQVIGDKKAGTVRVVDIDELKKFASGEMKSESTTSAADGATN